MHLVGSRRMTSREVERMAVMFQKQRLEVGQRVLLTKQAPYAVSEQRAAAVELNGLQFGKLTYQGFIDDEPLVAVASRSLVLMFADSRPEELRHPKMRIAQQGRHSYYGCQHLCIERAAAIAHYQVGPFLVADIPYQLQSLTGMRRQVRSQHTGLFRQSLTQGQCRDALAAGKEAMKEKQRLFLVI